MKRQSTRQYYLGQKRKKANMFLHLTKQALPWVPESFHARFQILVTSFEYRLTFQSILLQS